MLFFGGSASSRALPISSSIASSTQTLIDSKHNVIFVTASHTKFPEWRFFSPRRNVSSFGVHLLQRSRVRWPFIDDVISHLDDVFQKVLVDVKCSTYETKTRRESARALTIYTADNIPSTWTIGHSEKYWANNCELTVALMSTSFKLGRQGSKSRRTINRKSLQRFVYRNH